MKKIILLNAGSRTRNAFAQGVTKSELITLRSKEMIAHMSSNHVVFLNKGVPVDFTDAYVFTRLRASDAHFCGILYEHFEANRIKASDPINASFKASEEKISEMPRLVRANIPIPDTIIAREESYALNKQYILEHISFPLVYKTDGSQGKNVHKVNSLDALEALIGTKDPHELFILQELIPNTFDTRTLVAYGTILGSIKRSAKDGNFHNNVAQGGVVENYELTSEEKQIAINACAVCKIDFGGVDIIHTHDGPVVLEVNKSPQIKGFEKIHGENSVFSTIARFIEERR